MHVGGTQNSSSSHLLSTRCQNAVLYFAAGQRCCCRPIGDGCLLNVGIRAEIIFILMNLLIVFSISNRHANAKTSLALDTWQRVGPRLNGRTLSDHVGPTVISPNCLFCLTIDQKIGLNENINIYTAEINKYLSVLLYTMFSNKLDVYLLSNLPLVSFLLIYFSLS